MRENPLDVVWAEKDQQDYMFSATMYLLSLLGQDVEHNPYILVNSEAIEKAMLSAGHVIEKSHTLLKEASFTREYVHIDTLLAFFDECFPFISVNPIEDFAELRQAALDPNASIFDHAYFLCATFYFFRRSTYDTQSQEYKRYRVSRLYEDGFKILEMMDRLFLLVPGTRRNRFFTEEFEVIMSLVRMPLGFATPKWDDLSDKYLYLDLLPSVAHRLFGDNVTFRISLVKVEKYRKAELLIRRLADQKTIHFELAACYSPKLSTEISWAYLQQMYRSVGHELVHLRQSLPLAEGRNQQMGMPFSDITDSRLAPLITRDWSSAEKYYGSSIEFYPHLLDSIFEFLKTKVLQFKVNPNHHREKTTQKLTDLYIQDVHFFVSQSPFFNILRHRKYRFFVLALDEFYKAVCDEPEIYIDRFFKGFDLENLRTEIPQEFKQIREEEARQRYIAEFEHLDDVDGTSTARSLTQAPLSKALRIFPKTVRELRALKQQIYTLQAKYSSLEDIKKDLSERFKTQILILDTNNLPHTSEGLHTLFALYENNEPLLISWYESYLRLGRGPIISDKERFKKDGSLTKAFKKQLGYYFQVFMKEYVDSFTFHDDKKQELISQIISLDFEFPGLRNLFLSEDEFEELIERRIRTR